MATGIPDTALEEIRARTDLADLISSYGIALRRAGADYKACCPFHHEKTPSFVVHPDRGFYHCFGCGESGDVFKFVMRQEGLGFVDAAKKLARLCGVEVEERADPEAAARGRLYSLHAELSAFFRRCLVKAPEAKAAREYLARRGLSDEVAERFAIGYAPASPEAMQKWAEKYGYTQDEMDAAGVLMKSRYEGGRPFNRFGGRLMFTIRDRSGRPVAFSGRILTNDKSVAKYVNSPATPVFQKSRILFALDQAARSIRNAPRREAIVCEGQIDVIRCHACGFTTAVASQGTAFGVEHVQILKKCADSAVLVFDADGAGRKAALRVGGEFLAADMPVRVATLPPGEDPDSLLRDKGAEAFRACLDAAESITSFQIRALREAESSPDSIDAMTRVGREVIGMIAKCPSAMMRASLVNEAARLLGLPPSALEEDLAKSVERAKGRAKARVAAPAEHEPAASGGPAERPEPDDVEETAGGAAAAPAIAFQEAPPPKVELALCEFLFEHEGDASLEGLVARLLPPEALEHPFTRRFVEAWREGLAGASDAFASMRAEVTQAECGWLDAILLGRERSSLSELKPEEILQGMLRRIWMAALRRRQGTMAAESTPENDARRLRVSTLVRQVQRGSWDRAMLAMDASELA